MSINFKEPMGPEVRALIEETLDVEVMDDKTALLKDIGDAFIRQKQMAAIANAAKQPAMLEINALGDRKEVGGFVYELRKLGWYRMPLGTPLKR